LAGLNLEGIEACYSSSMLFALTSLCCPDAFVVNVVVVVDIVVVLASAVCFHHPNVAVVAEDAFVAIAWQLGQKVKGRA